MEIINIEVMSRRSVKLQTRPSGDVEIVVCILEPSTDAASHSSAQAGGVFDNLVAVIPKNRRNLLADFLKTNEQ